MGWIARLFRIFGGKKQEEQDASADYKKTMKLDMSEAKQEKSLGAEVHEWLDETQSLKDELGSTGSTNVADEDHTQTVPTLKESDLPDLDEHGEDDEKK